MAENIHIDLSDEIEQELGNRYQALCDELSSTLNSMYQELCEICTETKYEPMVNVVNTTINLFDEEIYRVAGQAFEEWLDSQGSFVAMAENSQAGDAALETARQFENNIRDMFEAFWSAHPLGEEVQIDTSRPKIKSEDFDTLKEIYTKFFQEIESLGEEHINQIKEAGTDDPTYNVIIPAVMAVTEPMKVAFEQFSSKVDEAKAESEQLKEQQDSKNEEAAQIATDTSGAAADIAEALKMFDDI